MDRKLAEQIVAIANGCIDQLIVSLDPVERAASPEEFAAYKRGVAKVISAFDQEIVERIAREYPDLNPDDDGDADAPDPPTASRN